LLAFFAIVKEDATFSLLSTPYRNMQQYPKPAHKRFKSLSVLMRNSGIGFLLDLSICLGFLRQLPVPTNILDFT
jgi:hypothetical protein